MRSASGSVTAPRRKMDRTFSRAASLSAVNCDPFSYSLARRYAASISFIRLRLSTEIFSIRLIGSGCRAILQFGLLHHLGRPLRLPHHLRGHDVAGPPHSLHFLIRLPNDVGAWGVLPGKSA